MTKAAPRKRLCVQEVLAHVAIIEANADDEEAAHGMEDRLRHCVLEAIAAGAPDAQELARAVLTTSDIDFARYCS